MTSVATTHAGPFTRDDLDALRPVDGGQRCELLDGSIIMTPAPGRWHQAVAFGLATVLQRHRTDDLAVKLAPFSMVLAPDTEMQPDILVARRSDLTDKELTAAALLVVEILSPSTRAVDQLLKRERYARAGIPHYWLVDAEESSVTLLRLDGRDYREVLSAEGGDVVSVEEPFPVEFRPADLRLE